MSEEMNNDFASMLKAEEESMQAVNVGDVVEATVVAVENSSAMVTIAGLKSDIPIPKRELVRPEPDSAEDVVKVGDVIEVAIVSLGGENGATVWWPMSTACAALSQRPRWSSIS